MKIKLCSGCGMLPYGDPNRYRKFAGLVKRYGYRICKCGHVVKDN